MRGSLRRCSPLLLLLAANACMQDFGSFHFRAEKPMSDAEEPMAGRDAAEPEETSDSPSTNPPPIEPRAGMEAHPVGPMDAGQKPMPPMTSKDASVPPEAARDEDAGTVVVPPPPPGPPQLCAADWPSLQFGSEMCRDCACGSCAQPMVDCLGLSDEAKRAACRAVLACAMRNNCQIGDCYCKGSACGAPSDSGDGPCAADIEKAAGGKRSIVQSKLQDPTLPADEPLGRAQRAIGCLFGTDDASPGPTLPASCGGACRVSLSE